LNSHLPEGLIDGEETGIAVAKRAVVLCLAAKCHVVVNAGGMYNQRVYHTSVVLPDGTVFITGGEIYGDGQTVVDTDDVVLLQRQEDIPLGVIDLRCQLDVDHTSVVLPDGTVFITGGEIYGVPFNEDERDVQLTVVGRAVATKPAAAVEHGGVRQQDGQTVVDTDDVLPHVGRAPGRHGVYYRWRDLRRALQRGRARRPVVEHGGVRQQDGQTVVDTDDVVLLQRQEDIPLGVMSS
jgi:hypothetical protein